MIGSTTYPEPTASIQHLFEKSDKPLVAGTFKPYLVITLDRLKEVLPADLYAALVEEADAAGPAG